MTGTILPERIGRYLVLGELGHGAMGRVYLAEDPRIGRRIALKALEVGKSVNPEHETEQRQRFLAEAQAAGRLSHRGIVTVFDADTDPETGEPYLVMEWIRGRTLQEILHDEGKLTISQAVDFVSQVAAALSHAHAEHVVHRDVKPANLLVDPGGTVKVTDFGIAKLKSQSLTLPGQVIGSPFYMAPEQVRGEKVDGRADLFALGAVLYECLTGQAAFPGDSLASITHKILEVEPRPAAIYSPELPELLTGVIDRALKKRPEDRFQTGQEFESDLRSAAGEPRRSTGSAPETNTPAPTDVLGTTHVAATPGRGPETLDKVSLSSTDVSATTIKGWPLKPGIVGLRRRLTGLATLAVLLCFLALFVRRDLEQTPPDRLPEWLTASPEWTYELLDRASKLPDPARLLPPWATELPDQLRQLPDSMAAVLERSATRFVAGGAPPEQSSSVEYPTYPLPGAAGLAPSLGDATQASTESAPAEWPPQSLESLLTPRDLFTPQAPATPPAPGTPQGPDPAARVEQDI